MEVKLTFSTFHNSPWLQVRRSQADKPIHSPRDSLISWRYAYCISLMSWRYAYPSYLGGMCTTHIFEVSPKTTALVSCIVKVIKMCVTNIFQLALKIADLLNNEVIKEHAHPSIMENGVPTQKNTDFLSILDSNFFQLRIPKL